MIILEVTNLNKINRFEYVGKNGLRLSSVLPPLSLFLARGESQACTTRHDFQNIYIFKSYYYYYFSIHKFRKNFFYFLNYLQLKNILAFEKPGCNNFFLYIYAYIYI